MATLQESIEVDVPITTAYNQWTQFETFPRFMSGVESVEQIDDTALHFKTDIAGVRREYNAQITDQIPDKVIAWVSTDKPRNAGTVTFESLDTNRTRVNVLMEWEPESLTEKAGAALGADDLQVKADLKKFKEFIEERGTETGGWRSAVIDGDVEDATPGRNLPPEFGEGRDPLLG
ncbi:SRPBCC family protein [Arthrobacter sp. ISL-30]|uniref:SRPBCC family protein n=1 Tax=Arthrobacter sp. ISL-30 TaxID=2819109 RepID=UPI001BE8D337|nr:SRPBCC family protein [Arthrobacter sp. ISL-30]MBT2515398.1 SRPBCC family protein [Arthrobacter sp. ISL-30]